MVFLGFLLVAAAVVVGAGVVLDNTGSAHLVVFDRNVPGISEEWQVFAAGTAIGALFVIGMMMTFMGAARRLRDRRDLRDLRDEHEESLTTLEMEKRRLQRELARVRQQPRPAPAPGAPAPAPTVPPQGRREPAAAPAAPRSQVTARSPFFDRAD
ncbi:hypothetical protein ACFOY4_34515 [Actinomadura syzygii]|uniref:hypothetical protein n=1 Tax=Actinomadura syzygii TaxID=1427538 RepID=UPI001652398E|nr:hypothetical protein [Actinomadura syzygii]